MSSKIQYQKIRTYSDLRIERMRVEGELETLGERIRGDWQGLSQMFSVGYLMNQITGQANRMYTYVRWGMSGYHFIRSMVEKYKAAAGERKKQHGGQKPQAEEETLE